MRGMTPSQRSTNLNTNITGVTRLLMARRNGMTQSELAEALGVHKTLISRSFRGERSWRIEDLEAMAQLFDVSPALFFDSPETLLRSRCSSTVPVTLPGQLSLSVAA
jgi:transcriptional regulator with XRE-family HTH domain